jgi:DNA topoisomerase-1
MRYVMKSLQHNGIYVPPYEYKGFSIRVQGQLVKMGPKAEQMAQAWVRKSMSPTSPPDIVYFRNFMGEFLEQLKSENPNSPLLVSFSQQYMAKISSSNFTRKADEKSPDDPLDFSEVEQFIAQEQLKKLNMPKEEKKRLAAERKSRREALREKFGYAFLDGKKIEIANWTAEPSCLFAGRGEHPKRGKWKEGPKEEEITLNLPPGPRPPGNWKDIVWEPDKMYLAKWNDKLSGKVKYVWFSDSAFLKQNKEKEKFEKAEKLGKYIPAIQDYIIENLESEDALQRKLATVSWLIFALNMRVGDEKDPGEADTVGAITLRPEHIKIEKEILHFDFLGKDCVRWINQVKAPQSVVDNIRSYIETCKEYLFEDIDSKKVSRFLSREMKGLTAKVFRTWRTTTTVKDFLDRSKARKEDPEYVKLHEAKMANLEAAKVANHKRKVPVNFKERLAKKEAKLIETEVKLRKKAEEGKKTDSLAKRMEKAKLDIDLTKKTEEYNLGTSLKSYIDPNVYVRWAESVGLCLDKFYPKTLRKKFSWALEGHGNSLQPK